MRMYIERQTIDLVGGPHDGGMFISPGRDGGYPMSLYFAHNRRECSETPLLGHPYRYVLAGDGALARYLFQPE